ncbi:MAG TPA: disulfide bond formation protein B [Allosphingosinicella sp.]|nr:disulfide bond formation protein B [Allosphingosinicella sp.]HKT14338.1 disulfide bond formation protein B [Allosphingosinicella sp.]
MTDLGRARFLALLVPAALLAGAIGSQVWGGLYPCEMCHWQRWGHYAAVVFALISFVLRGQPGLSRLFVWLATAGIAASGAIGVYHAGVEAGVFEGFTRCTAHATGGSTAEILADIMATPLIRCDAVQWSWLGISMAGWNAIVSIGSALVIAWLLIRKPRLPL